MLKAIFGLLLVGLAVGGLWWSGLLEDYLPKKNTPPVEQMATTTPPQQPASDLPTAIGDSSDAAIVQDSAAVDMQLQALDDDRKNTDESLNDKQTPQEF